MPNKTQRGHHRFLAHQHIYILDIVSLTRYGN